MGKATQDLRNEHDAILYVLQIMEKMTADSGKEPGELLRYEGELVYFLQIFADKCHHGKEENILFPELVRQGVRSEGGPVGEMLVDHQLGRQYIARMSQALEAGDTARFAIAAGDYRALLLKHIEKENGTLFPMADRLIDEKEQDELFERFESHEEDVVGHGVHEKLHAMIDQWAQAFGVE